MKSVVDKIYRLVAIVLGALFIPVLVSAQGLTLSSETTTVGINPDYQTIGLIALRYFLILVVLIFGLKSLKAGHNWIFHEGNAIKAYDNKQNLSKYLLIITVFLFLMALYSYFIPDYGVLSL